MAILKKGLSGEPVRRLQAKLGIEADGEFGPNTEKALKDWQTKNSLSADGIAGPDTFMAMGLYELVLLKQGTRGDAVKKLQEKLAIGADGQFGSATERAVRDYQQKNGLVVDGMAGPATLAHMKIFKEITADMPVEHRTKIASIAGDVLGLARRDLAKAPAQASLSTDASLQARKDLNSMGLRYFDAKDYLEAVKRDDALAVELFIAGRGVNLASRDADGRSAAEIARTNGNARLAELLAKNLPAAR